MLLTTSGGRLIMGNPLQDVQTQSRINKLIMVVDKLNHDLETQKAFSHIMISSLVAALNELSEKRNAYEVLTSVIEGFKSQVYGKNEPVDEAISEALNLLKRP
jgi:hypothetical protein